MVELLREYLPAILVAVLIGIIVGFLLFRPRQRVRLSDSTPVRPHMAAPPSPPPPGEGSTVAAHAAAAASDVSGQFLDAPVHDQLGPGSGLDDFQQMKGVGPKFAQMLQARGFTRFEQLAKLTPDEMERVDSELGPFRGRLQRDCIVEQADYLARGDVDGFQQRFGKL